MKHQLERTFTLSRLVFQPAPTATAEEARKVHRLRVPLTYDGDDQAAVFDFAAAVRGEDLRATIKTPGQKGAGEVVVVRLEQAGMVLGKGSERPELTVRLLLESEKIDPIWRLARQSLDAAEFGGQVELLLELIQERLPGMEEALAAEEKRGDEIDAKARGERATGPRATGRRRPKGSSPAPAS